MVRKKLVLWDDKIPWYGNFKIRPVTINGYVFFIGVLFLVWAYQADMSQYQAVVEDPCSYCELGYACSSGGYGWNTESGIDTLPSDWLLMPNSTRMGG